MGEHPARQRHAQARSAAAGRRVRRATGRPASAGCLSRDVDRVHEHQSIESFETIQVVEHRGERSVDLDRDRDRALGTGPGVRGGRSGRDRQPVDPGRRGDVVRLEDERAEVRGRRNGRAQRAERRRLLRCIPAQLLEPPDRILQVLLLALRRGDLVARVREVLRGRREQQEVPQQDDDDAAGDERDQRPALHGVVRFSWSSRFEPAKPMRCSRHGGRR